MGIEQYTGKKPICDTHKVCQGERRTMTNIRNGMMTTQFSTKVLYLGGIRVANFRCLMRSKPLVNILLLLSRNSSVIKEKASKTYQLVSSKGMQISDDYRRSLRISTLILLRTTSRHNQSWPLLHFCSTSCCFLPPYQNSL